MVEDEIRLIERRLVIMRERDERCRRMGNIRFWIFFLERFFRACAESEIGL